MPVLYYDYYSTVKCRFAFGRIWPYRVLRLSTTCHHLVNFASHTKLISIISRAGRVISKYFPLMCLSSKVRSANRVHPAPRNKQSVQEEWVKTRTIKTSWKIYLVMLSILRYVFRNCLRRERIRVKDAAATRSLDSLADMFLLIFGVRSLCRLRTLAWRSLYRYFPHNSLD